MMRDFENKQGQLEGFRQMLMPKTPDELEAMAQRARALSLQHFGKAVQLYTPIYLSNYCTNQCSYCSYHHSSDIKRKVLRPEEIENEAKVVAATGIRHVLLLTGDDVIHTPVSYLEMATRILRKYFDAVAIEVYALTEVEYSRLIAAGITGVTLYQETYAKDAYQRHHLKGPKSNYELRLQAVEHAAKAGIRSLNMGVLLGLHDPLEDVYALGVHLREISRRFPAIELSVSLPRLIPYEGIPFKPYDITDEDFVRMICALRIFMPHVAQNISTREEARFRKFLLNIGINKISAGVSTEVGGYSSIDKSPGQFEIADHSSVEEVKSMLIQCGCQPVMKDWVLV